MDDDQKAKAIVLRNMTQRGMGGQASGFQEGSLRWR